MKTSRLLLNRQVSSVVSVFAQILEIFIQDSEAAIVDAYTAKRMGHLLRGMQVSFNCRMMFALDGT